MLDIGNYCHYKTTVLTKNYVAKEKLSPRWLFDARPLGKAFWSLWISALKISSRLVLICEIKELLQAKVLSL